MAGLIDYITLGVALSAGYIGVKYGPQIIQNMQAGSKSNTQTGTQPTDGGGTTTSTSPTTTATEVPSPVRHPLSPTELTSPVRHPLPGAWNPRTERIVAGTITPVDAANLPHPRHQNDTGTYPHSNQKKAAETIEHPVPSGSVPTKRHPHADLYQPGSTASVKGNVHCLCMPDGTLGGPGCDLLGRDCSLAPNAKKAYLGYANSYTIPVEGPQWRKSIPYNQVIASQGMKQGRVKRALAANNHNFMPAGFVLSESSVRRGINNVYSAGT